MSGRIQSHGGKKPTQPGATAAGSTPNPQGGGSGTGAQGSSPLDAKTTTVKTKKGDTLASLASAYGVTPDAIRAHNSGDKTVSGAQDDAPLAVGTSVVVPASRKAKDAYNAGGQDFTMLTGGGNTTDNPDDIDYGTAMPTYTGSALSMQNADWTQSTGPVAATQGDAGSNNGNNPNIASSSGSGGAGNVDLSNITPTSLSGNTNAQKIFNFLVGKGLTKAQAAGVIGNLMQESGCNPGSKQAGGLGRGIAQWSEGGRWTGVEQLAAKEGKSPYDLGVQCDYLWAELNSSERGSLTALKATSTPQDAAIAFERAYERAGTPNMQNRINNAAGALKTFG